MLILIVEDEPALAMLAEVILVQEGHRILGPASNVEEALTLADRERPDLAITDLHLARGECGFRLAQLLSAGRKVPTVVMSGGDDDAAARVRDMGLTYLSKPFGAEALIEAVHRVGSGSNRARSVAPETGTQCAGG